MKLIIDIDDKTYKDVKQFYDNISEYECIGEYELAIAEGTPLSKFLEELERKILMEVDGGTDDMYIRYTDICNRVSNSIDEYKAESEDKE